MRKYRKGGLQGKQTKELLKVTKANLRLAVQWVSRFRTNAIWWNERLVDHRAIPEKNRRTCLCCGNVLRDRVGRYLKESFKHFVIACPALDDEREALLAPLRQGLGERVTDAHFTKALLGGRVIPEQSTWQLWDDQHLSSLLAFIRRVNSKRGSCITALQKAMDERTGDTAGCESPATSSATSRSHTTGRTPITGLADT